MIHHSAEGAAVRLIQHFRADPNNKYLHRLLAKLLGVTDKKLELLSVGTFIYGTTFMVEGIGLMLQKKWAEYMTIFTTAGLIPLEVYEIVHHVANQAQAMELVVDDLLDKYRRKASDRKR